MTSVSSSSNHSPRWRTTVAGSVMTFPSSALAQMLIPANCPGGDQRSGRVGKAARGLAAGFVQGALQGLDVAGAADRVDAGALRGERFAGQLRYRGGVDLLAHGPDVGLLHHGDLGDPLAHQGDLDL